MIPILYESNETSFTSNGLGRLRDCLSCVCSEERNSLYEVEFEYPVNGVNFDRIQCGRIIGVTHDDGGDIQPFDIVGYSRPINGVVTFRAVHISYRQCALTVIGNNINSLADAFTMLQTTTPANPFTYWTDKSSTGFMAAADSIPHSVRQTLGGLEGSILDAYGGEYEWDKWQVKLWQSRGQQTNFTIRYGVNLTDYQEEMDYSDTYVSVVPYWTGQNKKGNDIVVVGNEVTSASPSFNGTDRCIPLDLTEKFDTKPTTAQLESEASNYLSENQTHLPEQNITVDFVRLADSDEYSQFASLQKCRLCDTINVYFPAYNMSGQFKVVKTEYDVLKDRYKKLELGTLSATLSDAMGISPESSQKLFTGSGAITLDDFVVEDYTHSYSNISSGGNMNWEESKTKSGYYPVGVVGFKTNRATLVVDRAYIDSAQSGSCKIYMHARAVAAASANDAHLYVLWIKES